MRQRSFLFLFLLLKSVLIESQNISSGLLFSAHNAIKEERTSLVLSPKFDASKGFVLDFDIKLRPELHNYGYIFRIIIDNGRSYDLIANFPLGKRSLNLIEGNDIYLSFEENQLNQYVWNKWSHIQCFITPNEVKLSFDKHTLQHAHSPLDIKDVQFYFGYSNHPKFHSSDVPPMSIRNIRISDATTKTIAYWPLKEHLPHSCLDSLHQIPAQVSNPTWEINKHTKWTKEKTIQLPIHTQICDALAKNNIYFSNSTYTLSYSMADNTLDTLYTTQGTPYIEKNNQLIYNPYYNELWSYDFDNQKTISSFDFEKRAWTNNDHEIKNPNYSQHNAFISPYDSCLYIFGGYGNYQYRNEILRKSKWQDNWQSISYESKIPPRYLSGSGFKDKNTLLLLGGCGNPQGKQELGVTNYYDLYAIDINTFKTKKVWTMPNDNMNNFVVGNNIVVDEKNNKLYALCFPNDCSNSYILLKSFDLDSGSHITNYADTIPFTFNDVNSFCTLYYDSLQSQLYAVTNYNNEKESDISIYSLAYPPLNIEDTLQADTKTPFFSISFLLGFGCCLIIGVAGYFYFSQKKKLSPPPVEQDNAIQPPTKASRRVEPSHKKSAILFLDGFQVWDRDGKDITKAFTPILKQLLILIVLYGESNKKGISNVTLRELLWFDKNDESAQNNRRVNIRKLKLLLEQLDGVEIVKENTYWFIKCTETYCDYIEACTFIDRVKNHHQLTAQNAAGFPLELLAGQLLPYVQADWLDSFKSNYSNSILDTSISLSKLEYIQANNELLIRIANVMFAHDKTDEYALIIKCQALYKNGRTSLAKATFDTFCNEYKTILNADYTKAFSDIISKE